MKKISMAFIAIISFLIFTASVNAGGNQWIEYNWAIKQGKASNYLYYDFTIEDSSGYITISMADNSLGVLRKIAKDGKKIIWERPSDDSLFLTLSQDDFYYYTVDYDMTYYNFGDIYFCRHDKSNGELESCIFLDGADKEIYGAEIYVHDDEINVSALGLTSEGVYGASRFYTISSSKKELKLEKAENYQDVLEESLDEDTYYRDSYITNSWYDLYPDKSENILISNQYASGDAYYIIGDCIKDGKTKGFIMKTDSDKNVQWVKKSEEGYHFFDASSPHGSFVAVAVYKDTAELGNVRNPESVESYVYVYNEFGELVEVHDIAKEMNVKRADITTIVYQENALLVQAFAYDENGDFSSYLVRYLSTNSITKDISGEGIIDVSDRFKPGEKVSFMVSSKDGYIIKSVRVIDEDGNEIATNDNKFIMPSSDVMIKATFVEELKENPETGLIDYLIPGSAIILSMYFIFIKTRKYKTFRRI